MSAEDGSSEYDQGYAQAKRDMQHAEQSLNNVIRLEIANAFAELAHRLSGQHIDSAITFALEQIAEELKGR